MDTQKRYKRYKNISEYSFWIFSFFFTIFQIQLLSDQSTSINFLFLIIKSGVLNTFFALSVYINLRMLIPRFLKNKHYIFYTFWLLITLASSALIVQLLFLFPFQFLFSGVSRFDHFHSDVFSAFFFANLIYVAITSFAKFVVDWLVLQDISLRYNKIEKEKLEAELKVLKAQINPHFLFNSLNNIYSLALSNSKETPRLILMLSDLMRHVLYESKEDFIPLAKEISFVNNFIELQKLRLNDQVDLRFTMEGSIPNKRIVPLLFEPFIDNAFKHGLKSPSDHPFIHISFQFSDDNLIFKIKNNYDPHLSISRNSSHGIGLTNVEKRLEFLYRKQDYKLEINPSGNVFSVILNLTLRN